MNTDYWLPRLRQELAEQTQAVLSVDNVVVEDTSDKFDADLAIPVFAYAAKLSTNPEELAQRLASEINHDAVDKVEAAGGFVNIWLKPAIVAAAVATSSNESKYGHHRSLEGVEVVIEHTDPNPFKELHIGHLYSNTVGESIARLHETAGAKVHRVSYHGDVGLHIAKALWALGKSINWQPQKLVELERQEWPDKTSLEATFGTWTGKYYSEGSQAFAGDDDIAEEITKLNQQIYQRTDDAVSAIYDWGKTKSFEYFDLVYKDFDTPSFEQRFLESQAGPKGLELVKNNLDSIFESSDGAVIFRDGDEHTRVFINSQGLPTYEAKELGLAALKQQAYPDTNKFIIITANEINAYFKVVLKALKLIEPELADKTRHISHGLVKLSSGKMSSRTGDVVSATTFLLDIQRLVEDRSPDSPSVKDNALAAIKYAFLKQNIGGDIVYDIDESISLEGQSGPYVQYAAVRLSSILAKTSDEGSDEGYDWQAEKELLMQLARYPEVTAKAVEELAPHRVAQYAYELAREFNRYYENVPVKDAEGPARAARVKTIRAGLNVISSALGLLNIPVPQKM